MANRLTDHPSLHLYPDLTLPSPPRRGHLECQQGTVWSRGKEQGLWNQTDLGLDLNAVPSWASYEASLNPTVLVSYCCCNKLPL